MTIRLRAPSRSAALRDGGVPDETTPRGAPWWPLLFSGVWLLYLAYPLADAWRVRDTARGVGALFAIFAFAATYLFGVWTTRVFRTPRGQRDAPPQPGVLGAAAYAAILLLAALVPWLIGQDGTVLWVFVAVSGLWTFRMRVAVGIALLWVVVYEVCVFRIPGWERDYGVSIAILTAVLAVAGSIVTARRQRDLNEVRRENARLLVEEERNRIARDIHDILGHSLTVITVKAELAGRLLELDPARARTEVADLERLAREALADVRAAVEGFREISLSGELARAREALTSAGIRADLPKALDEVPASLRETYAWAVREGVTNVIRHSGATVCAITLSNNGIRITDDGSEPEPAEGASGGHGLAGLRERADAAGARLVTRTLDPHGFELSVVIPDAGGGAP